MKSLHIAMAAIPLLAGTMAVSAPRQGADSHILEIFSEADMLDRRSDTIVTGAEQLRRKAFELYREAADSGYAPACNYLGFMYYSGRGTERSVDSALYWIERAADLHDIKATHNLAWLLLQGEGVPRDTVRALGLLDKAATAGYEPAAHQLLALQRESYVTLPPREALDLGLHYYNSRVPGIGVILFNRVIDETTRQLNSDDSLAPLAADSIRAIRGHAYALLGDAYTRNEGVRYNHTLSVENYLRGALDGNAPAQFVIGELLEIFPDAITGLLNDLNGEKPQHDDPRLDPHYWYDKAAAQGVTDASAATTTLLASP